MKDAEIATMSKVAVLLEKYLPVKEYELYKEYMSVYERVKAKREKQSQNYQAKAEHHREVSRKWRQDNKEKNYAYQKEYNARKRAVKS